MHGMVVRSGDHRSTPTSIGAVVIPHDVADKVAGAFDLMSRREAVVIEASRDPDFTVEKLKAAFKKSAAIKA